MPELLMDEGMPGARSVGGLHDSLVPRAMELIGANAAVLDVGCAGGTFPRLLAHHQLQF